MASNVRITRLLVCDVTRKIVYAEIRYTNIGLIIASGELAVRRLYRSSLQPWKVFTQIW